MTDEATWIADGTKDVEPETIETPATEDLATPEVVAAPEVVAESMEAATVVEAVAGDEPPVETAEEVVQKFIEGKLGDEAFQLPEGVHVPLKRGDTVEYVPIQDVLKGGMLERDYRAKTTELSNERRAFEASQAKIAAEKAKIEARAQFVAEQEAEIKAALTNPESAAQYQQHLDMLEKNPMYRKAWDERLAHREIAAERDALRANDDARVVQEASTTARGWIESLASEFAGVDPGRVASIYGQRLSAGQASLDISDVRSIYQAEADYLERASAPLREQFATLEATVHALKASQAAEEQNQKTQHAVQRARTVPVSTGSGAPAKAYTPPGKFGPHELAERNAEWANAG